MRCGKGINQSVIEICILDATLSLTVYRIDEKRADERMTNLVRLARWSDDVDTLALDLVSPDINYHT